MHICKNICERIGIKGSNNSLYKLGMNYCTKCAVLYHTGAARCFCCGGRLRYKSRSKKSRSSFKPKVRQCLTDDRTFRPESWFPSPCQPQRRVGLDKVISLELIVLLN